MKEVKFIDWNEDEGVVVATETGVTVRYSGDVDSVARDAYQAKLVDEAVVDSGYDVIERTNRGNISPEVRVQKAFKFLYKNEKVHHIIKDGEVMY